MGEDLWRWVDVKDGYNDIIKASLIQAGVLVRVDAPIGRCVDPWGCCIHDPGKYQAEPGDE